MDSSKKLIMTTEIQDIVDDLTICEGSTNDLDIFISYIELTRNLQELYQWYGIFNYNYGKIKKLYPNGDIDAINSHTISLISAGTNMISSIELCISHSLGEKRKEQFKCNFSSKEYDTNFSYRFLTRLRNFTQHGYIPVSRFKDRLPCFDIYQIYDAPYYNFNKTLKKEIQSLSFEVENKTKDTLTLSYRYTVCSYAYSIYKIFGAFMNEIQPCLYEKYNVLKKASDENAEILSHKNHPELNGWIFYIIDEDNVLHCFNTNDDPTLTYVRIKNDCNFRRKTEQKDINTIEKNSVPLFDNDMKNL